MWVQAIGLFAQATCAPECWHLRLFNQRLLVLHVGGGAVKQRVKFKTNKFQNKNKKKSVQKEKNFFDSNMLSSTTYVYLHMRKLLEGMYQNLIKGDKTE